MVTQASPKFNFTYFSHNHHNYLMLRDVPECSGMFRDVPRSWFYRRPLFFGSEFWRHPEGLSFSGLGSQFSRSEFSRHPKGAGSPMRHWLFFAVSLGCADETKPGRNSCPRLQFLALSLHSIMSLSR